MGQVSIQSVSFSLTSGHGSKCSEISVEMVNNFLLCGSLSWKGYFCNKWVSLGYR